MVAPYKRTAGTQARTKARADRAVAVDARMQADSLPGRGKADAYRVARTGEKRDMHGSNRAAALDYLGKAGPGKTGDLVRGPVTVTRRNADGSTTQFKQMRMIRPK